MSPRDLFSSYSKLLTQSVQRAQRIVAGVAGIGLWMGIAGLSGPALAAGGATYLDQGAAWTPSDRKSFYTRDQGSRLISARWLAALKQSDGNPFLADGLSRYGYLPMDTTGTTGLPIGFTVASDAGEQVVGITCAACHTRQIVVGGTAIRIDGGPALADFQTFLLDLDDAVSRVLTGPPAAFADFTAVVLGPSASSAEKAQLKTQLTAWHKPFNAIVRGALIPKTWGPGRLDAVGMIINRLAGLDIGTGPDRIIAGNIRPATAPARYPFLWNAAVQDKTQWPGIADNGSDLLGLARNVGEVIGVFARFEPKKSLFHLLGVDYGKNSVNFSGLDDVESLVKKIGPPQWAWDIDKPLAAKGEDYYRNTEVGPTGGCITCHALRPVPEGETRFPGNKTWKTPLIDVGTDSREWAIVTDWDVDTGVLNGARIPFLSDKLKPRDKGVNVLRTAVVGTILQHTAPFLMTPPTEGAPAASAAMPSALERAPANQDLKGAFTLPSRAALALPFPYESRVLEGIWAAAPYLHNGSVPTLADLLKPAAQRPDKFKLGPAYNIEDVGLAGVQPGAAYEIHPTDCSDRNSGNSRCGHEYGTGLNDDKKKALLEFLKTL